MSLPPDIQIQIHRCDSEIQELQNKQGEKAFGIAIGINDWEMEKNMLLNNHVPALAKLMDPTVARERLGVESNALEVGSGLVAGAKTAQGA